LNGQTSFRNGKAMKPINIRFKICPHAAALLLCAITSLWPGAVALAQLPAGTVLGWGQDSPGIPAGVTNAATIAVGTSGGNLILNNDGTVTGWGSTGLPGGLSNVMAVARIGARRCCRTER